MHPGYFKGDPNGSFDTFKAPKDSPTNAYHPKTTATNPQRNCMSSKKTSVQNLTIQHISYHPKKDPPTFVGHTASNILKNRHPAGPGHERCFFEISVSWCSGFQGVAPLLRVRVVGCHLFVTNFHRCTFQSSVKPAGLGILKLLEKDS